MRIHPQGLPVGLERLLHVAPEQVRVGQVEPHILPLGLHLTHLFQDIDRLGHISPQRVQSPQVEPCLPVLRVQLHRPLKSLQGPLLLSFSGVGVPQVVVDGRASPHIHVTKSPVGRQREDRARGDSQPCVPAPSFLEAGIEVVPPIRGQQQQQRNHRHPIARGDEEQNHPQPIGDYKEHRQRQPLPTDRQQQAEQRQRPDQTEGKGQTELPQHQAQQTRVVSPEVDRLVSPRLLPVPERRRLLQQ